MNNQATLEKMHLMKFYGMLTFFKSLLEIGKTDLTVDEAIGNLIDAEWDERYNRKLKRTLNNAKFRYQASFEQMDFDANRNLNKNEFTRLVTCDWLKKGQSLIITGPTGSGKSYIACALGHQACKEGFKILYFNCMQLFAQLKYAKADGSYFKEMNKIQKQHLIVLDDFGLQVLDSQSRLILFEILEDRHGRKSTIIGSQIPVNKWHEIIGDATIADAICDRIVHSSNKIELKGESMRKKNRKNS